MAWPPCRREFFFKALGDSLMVVAVRPGPRFYSEEPRLLFRTSGLEVGGTNTHMYDVAPDDRRFVFLRLAGGTQSAAARPNLVRVDNWFTELGGKRRTR